METDQEVAQAQRGLAVPCLMIFAATYVLGVFVCGFAILIKSHGDPILTIMFALLAPLGFFFMLLDVVENYPLEIVCFGVLLIMGYVHLVKWLRFENRRKVNLAIAFVVAGGWVWWSIYAATHLGMFF